jgi:predicted hotdog family 3-hydroxylacyl-ACP dehydratase
MREIHYPAIEALIPHRENMCLLKRVVHYADKEIELETEVEVGAWYLNEQGQMPTWITLEMMAQAAAAYSSMERIIAAQGGVVIPRVGVLLGARSLVAQQSMVPVGTVFRIKAKQTFRDNSGMGAMDAEIYKVDTVNDTLHETLVARTDLKVFELPVGMTLADLPN